MGQQIYLGIFFKNDKGGVRKIYDIELFGLKDIYPELDNGIKFVDENIIDSDLIELAHKDFYLFYNWGSFCDLIGRLILELNGLAEKNQGDINKLIYYSPVSIQDAEDAEIKASHETTNDYIRYSEKLSTTLNMIDSHLYMKNDENIWDKMLFAFYWS
jgi:hypothetical protein